MSLMLIAALQAAATATPEGVVRSDFDLADVPAEERDGLALDASRGCSRSGADEILVCGRRTSREDYPMAEMERRYATEPIVAEARLGGDMVGRAFVDSVTLDRGAVSTRVMVAIRLPF